MHGPTVASLNAHLCAPHVSGGTTLTHFGSDCSFLRERTPSTLYARREATQPTLSSDKPEQISPPSVLVGLKALSSARAGNDFACSECRGAGRSLALCLAENLQRQPVCAPAVVRVVPTAAGVPASISSSAALRAPAPRA